MSIEGTKREKFPEQPKYIGLFKGRVIAINPDAEEFEKFMGFAPKEDTKQFDYLGESDEGNTELRIDVWLEETKERTRKNGDKVKEKFKISFFLEDTVRYNREGNKTQYINVVGKTSWADDPNNLLDWFAEREYREAKIGEEQLYGFLKVWLGNLDYESKKTILDLDWKQLMRGDVKELRDQIDGEWCNDIVCLATIKTVERDDGIVEYQNIYNSAFLPTYTIKYFENINYSDPEIIEKLKNKKLESKTSENRNRLRLKAYEEFVLKVTDEDYGCKNYYILKGMQPYDPEMNLVSSEKAMSEDKPDY